MKRRKREGERERRGTKVEKERRESEPDGKKKRMSTRGTLRVSRRFRSRTEAVYYFNALSGLYHPSSHGGVVLHNAIAPCRETYVLSEIETSGLVRRCNSIAPCGYSTGWLQRRRATIQFIASVTRCTHVIIPQGLVIL